MATPRPRWRLRRATHHSIKAVTEAIEGFRFNSAIARLYEFVGRLRAAPAEGASAALIGARAEALRRDGPPGGAVRAASGRRVLGAPGRDGLVAAAPWPVYDPALADDDVKVLPVQINGKRRGEIRAPAGASKDEVWELISADSEIGPKLQGVKVVRFIHVPDRIANVVTQPA